MGQIDNSETSYLKQPTLRNIPEDGRIQRKPVLFNHKTWFSIPGQGQCLLQLHSDRPCDLHELPCSENHGILSSRLKLAKSKPGHLPLSCA